MLRSSKAAVALVLTFTAGCVDIIGFLRLYQTFTAHMTGVTVHIGQDLAVAHWRDVAALLGVVTAFVLGSVVARTLVEIAYRRRFRSPATAALAMEFVLLSVVALSGGARELRLPMALLLAAAMGAQTAALTRVGPLTVHTTFVTGMLNKLAQLLANAMTLAYDEFRGDHQRAHLRPQVHGQAVFMMLIWTCYLLGAFGGAEMQSRWAIRSLLVPAAVVFVVAAVDLRNPMAIEEEKDQGER